MLFCTSALFLAQAAIAGASDITVPSGTTVTTTQIINQDGDTLTVEDGGTIDTSATPVTDGVEAAANNQTVINDGRIKGDDNGIYVTSGDYITIANGNGATIEGGTIGITAYSRHNATINNANGALIQGGYSGVYLEGSDDAIINNTGTIIGYDRHAIVFTTGDNITVNNAGTILGANLGFYFLSSFGVSTVTNTGTIEGSIGGVLLEGSNATINNYGTIRGGGYGLRSLFGDATINNSGRIAGGIIFSSNTGTINNVGKIIGANGIDIYGSPVVTITNAGTIIGVDYALYAGNSSNDITLNLLAGSVLDGAVGLFGASPTLNIGKGLNVYFVYVDNGVDELTVTAPVPFVHDETNNIVYTVDPSGFALSQAFIQTTADAVHAAVRDGTGRGNAFGGGFSGNSTFAYGTGEPGFDTTGPRGWASGFGGYQKQDGNQAYGGLVTGGGFASTDRMYGAFLGGAYSQLKNGYDTQVIDAASYYGGLYGGWRNGPFWIEAAVMGGYSDFSSERTVANNLVTGGLDKASADYGGYFVSPSLTIGRALSDRFEISASGTYAGLFVDGYTETGTFGNYLTVASRDMHVAALRAEARYLAMQRKLNSGIMSVETWAGVDGFFNLGGGDVEASIAGLPIEAFSANFTDATAAGFAGIGFNHDNGNWSLKTSLEGRYGTDAYTEIRATATAALKF